jgi:hypothetical protein
MRGATIETTIKRTLKSVKEALPFFHTEDLNNFALSLKMNRK